MNNAEAGSIPAIMKAAMQAVKNMERDHLQTLAEFIYDSDGTNTATVKDVKEMLNAAAKDLTPLKQKLE